MESLIRAAVEDCLGSPKEFHFESPVARPGGISLTDLAGVLASLVSDESMGGPFLRALPLPIVIKDKVGRVVWCNRQFEILANGTLDELKGLTSPEIFGLPDKNPLTEAERLVVATGKAQQSTEITSDNRLRQTLRFGICDPSGAIHRIGVIAFDFSISLRPAEKQTTPEVGQAPSQSAPPDPTKSLEEQRKSQAL